MKTTIFMTMAAMLGMSPLFADDVAPQGAVSGPEPSPASCAPAGDVQGCPPCCPMEVLTVEAVTVAADQGDPVAQFVLAYMTETGQGVPQDADKAAAMYAAALPALMATADAGNPLACQTLARAYAEGKGVTMDPVKAKSYMKKAKDCGSKRGCCKGKKHCGKGKPGAGAGQVAPKDCCMPEAAAAPTAPSAGTRAGDAPGSGNAPTEAMPAADADGVEVMEVTVEGEAAPAQGM